MHVTPDWGEKPPLSDDDDRIRRAEMMGEAWGKDVHARLLKHLPHWHHCPRVRLRLAAAARAGASRRDGWR